MPVDNVSFGRVVAVTGKPRDIGRVNKRLKPYIKDEKILSYNVTEQYKYQPSTAGSISAAVSRGEEAYVYVTRADVKKVKEKQKGWDTIYNILSNMSDYVNLNQTRTNKALNVII